MKYLLLLWGALLCSRLLTAQTKQQVVYMKNGSIIRGNVYASDGDKVKIENRVKDTLVFAASEVERVVTETKPPMITKSGIYNIDEGGIQFSDKKGAVLRAIVGYRFAYQWQVGVGVGLDDYTIRSVPLFGDARYDFSKGEEVTSFVYGGAGVSKPWPTTTQSQVYMQEPDKKVPGAYAHGGVGIKLRSKKNRAFHMSAGYSYAEMKTKYAILDWQTRRPLGTYTTYNYSFSRVTFIAGFSF